jgi:hypothetical protein
MTGQCYVELTLKLMVFDGMSTQRIRNYLNRWVLWWVNASEIGTYEERIQWFLAVCWDEIISAYAAALLMYQFKLSRIEKPSVLAACA